MLKKAFLEARIWDEGVMDAQDVVSEIRRVRLRPSAGPETADSISLYGADRFIFPIDAYTIRLCQRLGVKDLKYEDLRKFFENSLPKDLEVYKEFHDLIDKLGN